MKKSKYKREICSGLTDQKRCKTCMFYNTRTIVELGSTFGMKGKTADLMYAVKIKGCEILREICPDCIVDIEGERSRELIAKMSGYNDQFAVEPAFVYKGIIGKKFYCHLCHKRFNHSQLKHMIDVAKLVMAERPDFYTTTFKQRLFYWLRCFKDIWKQK